MTSPSLSSQILSPRLYTQQQSDPQMLPYPYSVNIASVNDPDVLDEMYFTDEYGDEGSGIGIDNSLDMHTLSQQNVSVYSTPQQRSVMRNVTEGTPNPM